jgi:HK97 family phage prohead protease
MTTTLTAPEARTYATSLELRDVERTGYSYLEGRAVPYDTPADVGWFVETHAAGSFKASVNGGSGKRAPLLLFHDNRSFPIGHAEKWTHDDGLVGVWKLNGSAEAQRAADAAASGDLVGMSVGFMPVRSDWDYVAWDDWNPDLGPEHKDHVTRVESRLLEVSLTPTPVFADAEVADVRTAWSIETREAALPRPVRAADTWRAEADRLRCGPSD